MENLKNLEKIAKIFQPQNIITSEEIDQVLKGIMEILASYKKGTDAINEETKAVVNILLDKVVQSNKQTIDKAEIMFDDRMTDLETLLKDVKQMITDVETLASEVKDGKDADEEKIVEDVISRIKIDPTVVTVSAQEIKDKLSSLEGDNKLDISAVKGFELYSTKVDLDYAIKTLQHQTSFLINKGGVKSIVAGTNITVDNTDPSNPVISSTGGGGSIAIGDTITSATQGSILFAGASGVLAQDNSKLFWDDTNNILGVGTASPLTQTGNRLQVGDNSASNQYLVFQTSNGHDRGIHYYLSDGTSLRGYMKWDLNEDLLLKGDVTFISTQNLTNPFTFTDSGGAGIGLMGIGTTSPTHSLTLNSTATGIALYNTSDQTTNYERVQMYWTGNVYTIQTQKGGSGSNRNLTIGTVSRVLQFLESPTGTQGFYTFSNSTGGSLNALSITTTRSNSASVAAELTIQPTYNQSSTAGYTCLLINPTETTTGSGSKLLADFQVGGSSKAKIDNTGLITAPQVINTPATITVTSNAGTVTRANRVNNFTNSSAATMTITMSTTSAADGDMVIVRIKDFSAAAQTITWVNTENSTVSAPTTSNGSTTLPLTVGFQYNSATSLWRCIASA